MLAERSGWGMTGRMHPVVPAYGDRQAPRGQGSGSRLPGSIRNGMPHPDRVCRQGALK
ncbi:hypothetical protein AGMMS4952_18210 [Spirochaetia bacterium]|nr:hypothetical protein AGMMS4952_18210 [Spirochaetia bacterium]